eukprot:CAMPEP_0173366358 /NCGR_PEP_ID=MMETSP1144-20121109/24185_1 /TAXON_ID=483371 /ORGANISM="non described non described, Strain CCMP2298" /LENGTH=74 /DNA_ID=CAMNT_0014316987 /DNA_START=102 /DNA_END=323 /DNA_ORIENTATION=+
MNVFSVNAEGALWDLHFHQYRLMLRRAPLPLPLPPPPSLPPVSPLSPPPLTEVEGVEMQVEADYCPVSVPVPVP